MTSSPEQNTRLPEQDGESNQISNIKSEKGAKRMELKDGQAIDTMCRAGYAGIVTEEEWKYTWGFYESQACIKGTFGGVLKKLGVPAQDGWKVVASSYKPSLDEMIKEMDEIGVEKAFVDQQLIWSRRESKLVTGFTMERIAQLVQQGNGRV